MIQSRKQPSVIPKLPTLTKMMKKTKTQSYNGRLRLTNRIAGNDNEELLRHNKFCHIAEAERFAGLRFYPYQGLYASVLTFPLLTIRCEKGNLEADNQYSQFAASFIR